jgi:hypothetical protein
MVGLGSGDGAGIESARGNSERGRGSTARTRSNEADGDSGEDEREDIAECREYGVRRL